MHEEEEMVVREKVEMEVHVEELLKEEVREKVVVAAHLVAAGPFSPLSLY